MSEKITYTPPPDKSLTIRAIVIAALTGKKTKIKNALICDDTIHTIKLLKKLGCSIKINGKTITVKGKGLYGYHGNIKLNTGESALLLRLILPILLNQKSKYIITGKKTILRRNFSDTIIALQKLGSSIKHNSYHLPFIIYPSQLSGGSFKTSSAQVKSMLLLLSLYGVKIKIKEIKKTRNHTENILRYLGVKITLNNGWISAKGKLSSKNMLIPGDFSSASFFIVTAMIKKIPLTVKNTVLNQTRTGLLKILKKSGVSVIIKKRKKTMNEESADITFIPPKEFKPITVKNITDMIDEFPIISVFLSYINGKSKIRVDKALSNKESDRIKSTLEILKKLKTLIKYDDKYITIRGGNPRKINFINSHSDHRIAMTAGVIKALNNHLLNIKGKECVSKTYPDFWKDFNRYFLKYSYGD